MGYRLQAHAYSLHVYTDASTCCFHTLKFKLVQEVISEDSDSPADKEPSPLREDTKGRTLQPLFIKIHPEKHHSHEWASGWFM